MSDINNIDISLGLSLKINNFFSKEVQGSTLLEDVTSIARSRMREIAQTDGEISEADISLIPLSYILPALTDHDVHNLVHSLAKGAGSDIEESVNYLLLLISQEAAQLDDRNDLTTTERDGYFKVLAFSQMRLMRLSRSNKKINIARILQAASIQDTAANKLFSVLPTIFSLEVDQRKNQTISD